MSIQIITGTYGCGKTNYAVNLAMQQRAERKEVTLIDLDTVNPYYRSFDFQAFLQQYGISLIAPVFAGTNLDLPAITGEIAAALQNREQVIIDIGGDDAGAVVLGGYSKMIQSHLYEVSYLVNPYRTQTNTAQEALTVMRNIEIASKLPVTTIVGNPNLGEMTTAEDIYAALPELLLFSKLSGLPFSSILVEESLALKLQLERIPIPVRPITRFARGGVAADYSQQI